MRTWRNFLIGLGAIFLTMSFNAATATANTQNSSTWLMYQAAINSEATKKPFPWQLFNTTVGIAALFEIKTLVKEDGIWWGLHNGGRPTFYFRHLMKDYPETFIVVEKDCETATVINNGHRFETSNLIVKQSDVGGRGMALTNQAGKCTWSREAHILYYKEDMPNENPPIRIP
jgi:hypothetical protein